MSGFEQPRLFDLAGDPAPAGECTLAKEHLGRFADDLPAAEYCFFFSPCYASACRDRLVCSGHRACRLCAAAIRAGQAVWTQEGDKVEYHRVTRWSPESDSQPQR